ncbi:hypothetical protein BJV82DRAFT_518852 [Fennellomyces sp. T-0311]|nr:hypothetical protein BJV82DRAFT_518852 [Fennellomyces sp. T-0311]
MVYTVIYPKSASHSEPNLVFLEFQGNFQSEEAKVQNLKIGDITFSNDKATLMVGHHRLEGKKVKLAKPVAVIRKREHAMEEYGATFDTVSVMYEKYLFSQAPKIIVHESRRNLTRRG